MTDAIGLAAVGSVQVSCALAIAAAEISENTLIAWPIFIAGVTFTAIAAWKLHAVWADYRAWRRQVNQRLQIPDDQPHEHR